MPDIKQLDSDYSNLKQQATEYLKSQPKIFNSIITNQDIQQKISQLEQTLIGKYHQDFYNVGWHGTDSLIRIIWQDPEFIQAIQDIDIVNQIFSMHANNALQSLDKKRLTLGSAILYGLKDNNISYLASASPNWMKVPQPPGASIAWNQPTTFNHWGMVTGCQRDQEPIPRIIQEEYIASLKKGLDNISAALNDIKTPSPDPELTEINNLLQQQNNAALINSLTNLVSTTEQANNFCFSAAGNSTTPDALAEQCFTVMAGFEQLLEIHKEDPNKYATVLGFGLISHALDAKHLAAAIFWVKNNPATPQEYIGIANFRNFLKKIEDNSDELNKETNDLIRARLVRAVLSALEVKPDSPDQVKFTKSQVLEALKKATPNIDNDKFKSEPPKTVKTSTNTTVPIVLSTDLDQDFIKKGTKEKKGGAGLGGIYRKKDNGKDYLIKQPSNSTQTDSFRCHQEILASRLAIACGAAVPTMYEVQQKSTNQNANNIYVASEIIQHSADYNAAEIKKLQGHQKQNILSDCVVHAWLCNRDLVNNNGSNFVKDQDGRIYNVDLGQCLLTGFRGTHKHYNPDQTNFEDDPVKLVPFINQDGPDKFKLFNTTNQLIEATNKNQLLNLSVDNKQDEKSCYLQGVLKIDSLDDNQIKLIVNLSNDTEENKKIIIDGLISRKQKLIKYAKDTYGNFALQEEQAALYIQRIMHQAGVFSAMPSSVKGDSKVSWKAQFQNASKPQVKINYDNSFTLNFSDNTQASTARTVFEQLNISQNISIKDQEIIINNLNFTEFNKLIIQHMIADRLQILLGSHDIANSNGYKTPYLNQNPYKGANHTGLRPIIDINEDSDKITIDFDNSKITKTAFIELLNTNYGLLDNDYENSTDDTKIIIKDHKKFTQLASNKLGARKTAVVSENEQGYILAGKLDPSKKAGKQGFATAGGNSDTPMNPKKAAAEEGTDEFGHTVNPILLKPIGSTVLDNTPNIFLAPEKATSTTSDNTIGYKEFQDNSIKWYSFEEFRKQHSTSKFDRSSIEYYVKHYQREIQKKLHALGLNNFIVICSKKPETLGMIYIKPSIPSKIDSNQLITLEEESKLINILTTHGIKYQAKNKKSKINTKGTIIDRRIIEIDKDLNPAILLKKLSGTSYTEKFTEKIKKFIEFQECFNKKFTENTNIIYNQAAETEPTILGAIIATDSNNQLATIKQDSIECPITKNPEKKLINVQHQMFITFLEMHNDKDITIEANNFSYLDLKIILELIKNNSPKIAVKLQLPKEEQCINYDGQKYSPQEYQDAQQLVKEHNENIQPNKPSSFSP